MKIALFALVISVMINGTAFAKETHIMVRARAVDAKFIGTSVGGVKVVVEDAETGEILDQGWINGGTGNTTTLIKTPIQRGQTLTDKHTAGFLATVDIQAPRFLRFKLLGPYGYRQAMQQASVTSWVLPGKDILGNGIIIMMPGFIVDAWTQVLEGGRVDIYSKAMMLCGCPIYPDGPWDPSRYEVSAQIMQDEKIIKDVMLNFTGPVGIFSGKTRFDKNGHYKAIVTIFDSQTGNVGVTRTMFEISDRK